MRKTVLVENKGFVDLFACDAGHESCEASHKFGPHVRGYYLIHFVTKGEGEFVSPRGKYKLKEGEAFLIKPGEVTVYRASDKNPWNYVWIGFLGKLSSKFDELSDVFEYDVSAVSALRAAIESDSGREELLASFLFKLYASLLCGTEKYDYPNKVINYINAHYMENVTISDIADSVGLNRKYLARIFKQRNGLTMQEFLINKRLHEAKKLLKLGYNVEQSSYMVGYKDSFGFSKAFKKRYGKAPVYYVETRSSH